MAVAEFTRALQDTHEIELTVTGRRTGHKTSRPVWFVQDGEALYLLPVKGSDSEWFKNVLEHPTVTLSADGAEWTAQATPITDPGRVRAVVETFRAKYGADEVAKYYTKFDVALQVPLA
jgi:deazaflavin-dependent oxidoreductase (nitroreductase family)